MSKPADQEHFLNFIDFTDGNDLIVGIITGMDKGKFKVLLPSGKIVGVSKNKIRHISPPPVNTSPASDPLKLLKEYLDRRASLQKEIDVVELHQVLEGTAGPLTVNTLAGLAFGKAVSPEMEGTLLSLLHSDGIRFIRKNEEFYPRPGSEVEAHLRAIEAKEKQAGRDKILLEELLEFKRGLGNGIPSADGDFIPALKDMALNPESGSYRRVSFLLEKAGFAMPDGPFNLLVRLGIWDNDENLDLIRLKIPVDFPPEAEKEASGIAASLENCDFPGREDYTDLYTISIDGPETVEIDDALSIETTPEGYNVGIHLACPGPFLPPGGRVLEAAGRRAASIYMPDMKIRMMPASLSEDAFSLAEGKKRPALSVFIDLDKAGNITGSRFAETLIRVGKRYTYREADESLEKDGMLRSLYSTALVLKNKRLENGAYPLPFPKVDIWVEDDGTIRVEKEEADGPSQAIVSEAMILANRIAGEFCVENCIPSIFRVQEKPDGELPPLSELCDRDIFNVRRAIKKAGLCCEAAPHFSLGVGSYVQITSPIRRYLDLISQLQLIDFLRKGFPLYSEEEIKEVLLFSRSAMEDGERLERGRRNYWMLKYLEKETGKTLDGTVLHNFTSRALVRLDETMYECFVPAPGENAPCPGDRIKVRIEAVDPRKGTIRASVVWR
ncbi:MAG: RNB domain-containing ribonuclease [Chloroflexi bacterium]|nr:RNB domain-containing ribonuclease [Chloroflexota bacterium]